MKYVWMQVKFVSLGTANLPPFKGSMLRGAMGRALHELCCKSRRPSCASCETQNNCIYYHLYAATEENPSNPSMKTIPRPYTFRCFHRGEKIMKGEPLDFEITLVGRAIQWAPILAVCLGEAARVGLGVHRAEFEIYSARIFGKQTEPLTIFSDGNVRLASLEGVVPFEVYPPRLPDPKATMGVSLELKTPLRWANGVEAKTPIKARDLIKSAFRRISALGEFWDENEWLHFPFGPFYNHLDRCTISENQTRWVKFSRFSMTNQGEIPIFGCVGKLIIVDCPMVLSNLLNSLEKLHLGKGASHGGGWMGVDFF